MKVVVCEMCGAHGLVKRGGLYVCAECGTRYEAKEARRLLVDVTDGDAEGENQEESPVAERIEVDAEDESLVAGEVGPQDELLEITEDKEGSEPPATIEVGLQDENQTIAGTEDGGTFLSGDEKSGSVPKPVGDP